MIKEAIQFKEYVEINYPNSFEMKEVDNGDTIFSHRERQMYTTIVFSATAKQRVGFFAAVTYCAKEEKKNDLIIYLNEINAKTGIKFYLRDDGNIIATTELYHKETFLPELAISIYRVMIDTITKGVYDDIMKIIWS